MCGLKGEMLKSCLLVRGMTVDGGREICSDSEVLWCSMMMKKYDEKDDEKMNAVSG
jgi:hypothetical protein